MKERIILESGFVLLIPIAIAIAVLFMLVLTSNGEKDEKGEFLRKLKEKEQKLKEKEEKLKKIEEDQAKNLKLFNSSREGG